MERNIDEELEKLSKDTRVLHESLTNLSAMGNHFPDPGSW